MPDSIRIYRYMSAEWAVKSLQEARLRVSRIKELNDPFEWRVGSLATNPEHQAFMRETLQGSLDRLNDLIGILCFSGGISDPVIWSHYAAGHQGIALEFDHFVTPGLHEVQYENTRPVSISTITSGPAGICCTPEGSSNISSGKRPPVGTTSASIGWRSTWDRTA